MTLRGKFYVLSTADFFQPFKFFLGDDEISAWKKKVEYTDQLEVDVRHFVHQEILGRLAVFELQFLVHHLVIDLIRLDEVGSKV
jgi:hypothetical protein